MEAGNKVYPREDQVRGLLEPGVEGTVFMVKHLDIVTAGFTVQLLEGQAT